MKIERLRLAGCWVACFLVIACTSAQQIQTTNKAPYQAALGLCETNQPLRVNGPIWVKYSVSNLSTTNAYLIELDDRRDFKVSIRTESGQQLKLTPNNTVDEARRTTNILKPGRRFDSPINLALFCKIPGPGIYHATVGRRVYSGKGESEVIVSAPLQIKVGPEPTQPDPNER